MSSKHLTSDQQNFTSLVMVCVDLIKLVLKDILEIHIKPADLYIKILSCVALTGGNQKLRPEQKRLCYLPPPNVPDYRKFDVTLLYALIRNLCPSLKPTLAWGKTPSNTATKIGDDIERLRLFRNEVHGHCESSNVPDTEFQTRWTDIKTAVRRLQTKLSSPWCPLNYEKEFEKIENLELGSDALDNYKVQLEAMVYASKILENEGIPQILIQGDGRVICGGVARFQVLVEKSSITKPLSVTWQKVRGTIIEEITINTDKYKDSNDSQLMIHNVSKEDEGKYQVFIEKLKLISNSISLEAVGDLPTLRMLNVTREAQGIMIHYEYTVTDVSPKVDNIAWRKNGENLNIDHVKYVGGGIDDGHMVITSPTTEDAGHYTCTVMNAVGGVSESMTLDIPSATISNEAPVYVGSETQINSVVAACPPPEGITWQKSSDSVTFETINMDDSRYFGSKQNFSNPVLIIPKTTFDDKLYYRLFVWNRIGECVSNTLHLNVTGKSGAYEGGHMSVVEEPAKAGTDVNIHDKRGDIPLIGAKERRHASVKEKLVKARADGNLQEEVDKIGIQQECVEEESLVYKDPMVMFLLLCPSYKVENNDQKWISNYNIVAKKFGFTTITKLTDLSQPEKYKPVLDFSESKITFSADVWRDRSFLKAAESRAFIDIFLDLGDKKNIANYCRSPSYRKIEGEICYCLTDLNQIEKFVKRLGEDIFTHSAFQDQSIKGSVFQKGIPMQIIMRGDKSIQNFNQNLKKGKQKIYYASGMIIGCAGSGKTTLLKRLQNIPVEEIIKTTSPTRGVNVITDVFDVTDTLQVSKTGSPHRFRMTVDKPDQSDDKTSDDQLPEDVKDVENDQMLEDMKDESINADRNESIEEDDISPENVEPNYSDDVAEVHGNILEFEVASSVPQQYPEVSGIIPVSYRLASGDEIHPTRKISMTDFAGQCAYYASHQMFLSPRAFFLLVLNMKKKLNDVVDENVCFQKGSVYREWTYGDYLEFWLKSVHQYSSGKAPVLLVATHCEDTTEKERRIFFWNLQHALSTKDKSLLQHLAHDRKFSVSFEDDVEIEKIKSCIVKTVQNLDHWGQDLPQSWVLFETFLLEEKKKKKIIKRNEVIDFNKALNEDIQLNDDDIDVMLQFFHDIREILYFDQVDLKNAIILDIQWFSNAFKHIITDENHAKEDLIDHVMEWETFNKTGVLDGQLLDAIWNIYPDNYISHKKEIMLYMEKVGLLAAFSNGEEKWYIPSMNKIPFEKKTLRKYPSSSILCFQFDVLPVGIFYRLIALCIQVPFEILAGEDEQCIYQTAAIFKYDDHHHFVIGMTKSAIQLQAFVFSDNVDPICCHKIRQKVEGILLTCSNTFQSNFTFCVGYKCKTSGFCDEEESKIIPEEQFTKSSFGCPRCSIEKKHTIETSSIIKYWKELLQSKKRLIETKTNPLRGIASPFSKKGPQIDVKTSCIKAEVSKSVGLIYLPGGGGTGFRVGSKYIMTCLHVIKNIIKDDFFIDCGNIEIHFGKVDSRPTHIDQENLFRFKPTLFQLKDFDLAILELEPKVGRSFPPQLTLSRILNLSLDIHLIGHPGGVEMKEDSGVFVHEIKPNNDVDQYIYNLSHWGKSNLPGNIDYYEVLRELPRKILFHTTFDKGSSGGPGIMIQNYEPCVVLMISGGVPDCHYKNVHLVQHDERIEFGYAMEDICKAMEQSADENVKIIAAEIFTEGEGYN